jgi:hypothetical protein
VVEASNHKHQNANKSEVRSSKFETNVKHERWSDSNVGFGFVGGEFGRLQRGAVGAEEGEEAEAVAVAELGVFDVEAVEGGLGGLEEEEADAGVGGSVDVVAVAGERGDEVGVFFPVVEGGAVDAEDAGDGGDGAAGDEEGDRGKLARFELGWGC